MVMLYYVLKLHNLKIIYENKSLLLDESYSASCIILKKKVERIKPFFITS